VGAAENWAGDFTDTIRLLDPNDNQVGRESA